MPNDQLVPSAPNSADENIKIAAPAAVLVSPEKLAPNLQAQLQLMTQIVESSDNAVISKDLSGNVLSWNISAEQLYGYTSAEMIGKNISIIMPPDRQNELADILQKIARGERIERYETKRKRKDGQIIDVSIMITPIKNSAGVIIGASSIAHDISKQKIAEAKLKEQIEQAEKMNKLMVGRELKMVELKNEIQRLKNLHAAPIKIEGTK